MSTFKAYNCVCNLERTLRCSGLYSQRFLPTLGVSSQLEHSRQCAAVAHVGFPTHVHCRQCAAHVLENQLGPHGNMATLPLQHWTMVEEVGSTKGCSAGAKSCDFPFLRVHAQALGVAVRTCVVARKGGP